MRDVLEKKFQSIGARVKFRTLSNSWGPRRDFSFDVRTDKKGEYFEIALADERDGEDFKVLQAVPADRHLLLMANDRTRYLFGHDERHWFVSNVVDNVGTVIGAKQSLMPSNIANQMKQMPQSEVSKRKNAVYVRQGEWFFVPVEWDMGKEYILKNEPLQRTAGSKPHVCEEMIRRGGRLVYVVRNSIFSPEEFEARKKADASFANFGYRTTIADPEVYVRGKVRHSDHRTINLRGWHRAFLNNEGTTGKVKFLD